MPASCSIGSTATEWDGGDEGGPPVAPDVDGRPPPQVVAPPHASAQKGERVIRCEGPL